MKFGVWLPAVTGFTTGEVLTEVADRIEERAIDSIWVGEHLVLFDQYASSYPYSSDGRLPTGGNPVSTNR